MLIEDWYHHLILNSPSSPRRHYLWVSKSNGVEEWVSIEGSIQWKKKSWQTMDLAKFLFEALEVHENGSKCE